jgi:hypothetical protein
MRRFAKHEWGAKGELEWGPTLAVAMPDEVSGEFNRWRPRGADRRIGASQSESKSAGKTHDPRAAGRLQLNIERARANAAPIHRTKDLDVAGGVEAKPPRDTGFHKFDNAPDGSLRDIRRDEVEIAVLLGSV